MSKKKSFVVHSITGEEVVVTESSFCYCCGTSDGSIISVMDTTFEISESPKEVSKLLDELED